MSDRPQVTITLGRSGRVVKRARPISIVSHSDYVPSSGGRWPIRERLGSNVDNSILNGSQSMNKRQRRENSKRSLGNDDLNEGKQYMSKDHRVGHRDLRFKLARKNLSRRSRIDAEKYVHLREKHAQIPLRFDPRQHMPESKAPDFMRRIPPQRGADDLLQMDSLRKYYSSWISDGIRHRSPDRFLGASRGLSSPRNLGELRQVPAIRSVNTSRCAPFMTKGVTDASRPVPFMSRATVPVEAGKPILRLPPPSGIVQKISYMTEEPLTVANLLHSLGLGKYAILFQAEEVDMTALRQMGDNDLKDLGIPMGPRKKILLAVLPRSKRHP